MDATLTKDGPQFTLSLERRLAHSPEKVWRVLTERDLLRQWFPADVEGEWQVGSPLQFIFKHGEGDGLSDEELRGEVLAVEPMRLLEFRWGKDIIRCEVTPVEDGCRFLLSHTFEDGSMGARSAAGWEFCLENLDLLIQGASLAKFSVELWQGRFRHYAKKFEPAAGPQQGLPENYPATSAGG